ncbi:MAG: hypothetical protein F4W90_08665 [Gammaproteobacteria bacterium]|nr:hypothetical protein [Gammaproteobacteria bacterium]
MTLPLPPWLARSFDSISAANDEDRLTHALLISATPGWGATLLAERVVRLLLDVRDDLELSTNLDFINVGLEERKTLISIEQIRDAIEFLSATSRVGSRRLALIREADKMSIPASQALLKILEEPPADKYIVLVSTHGELLSPTIRSRCQRQVVRRGSPAEVKDFIASQTTDLSEIDDYLEDYGGAPFAALNALQERRLILKAHLAKAARAQAAIPELARDMRELDVDDILMRWQFVTLRLAHNTAHVEPVAVFYDQLSDIRRQFREVPGLDRERQYIRLLIKWQHLLRGHQRLRS